MLFGVSRQLYLNGAPSPPKSRVSKFRYRAFRLFRATERHINVGEFVCELHHRCGGPRTGPEPRTIGAWRRRCPGLPVGAHWRGSAPLQCACRLRSGLCPEVAHHPAIWTPAPDGRSIEPHNTIRGPLPAPEARRRVFLVVMLKGDHVLPSWPGLYSSTHLQFVRMSWNQYSFPGMRNRQSDRQQSAPCRFDSPH